MNARQKAALQGNRTFLSKNIVFTEEFTNKLLQETLVTEYMLKEVQSRPDRESRVLALIDVLPLRGGKSFETFCDVLQLTGHFLLADFLRDEESHGDLISLKDLNKRLPFVEKNLRDYEKKRLETFIRDTVKEEILKHSWKKDIKEKDKTLTVKEKQIEQTLKYGEEKKQNQMTISELEQKLKVTLEEVSMLKIQTAALKQSALETESRHKQELNRQIKFNMANDSSLRRIQEKIEYQAQILEKVREKVNTATPTARKDLDKDDFGVSDVGASSLLQDLETVIDKIRQLSEVEKRFEALQTERDWIIMHLGADSNGTSLVQAYKNFAVQNDENLHSLKNEVARYSDIVREQESDKSEKKLKEKISNSTNVWQTALMSILKKQVQDLKTTSKQKDRKISDLENEINSLKSTLDKVEKTVAKHQDQTDSVTEQLDETSGFCDRDWKQEASRTYKNSFLPPLPSNSPVEQQVVPSRKPKGPQINSLSSWNRGVNPRAHHLSDGLAVNSYRSDSKVRYGQPYHTLSQGLNTIHNKQKFDFQIGEKAIIGKKIN